MVTYKSQRGNADLISVNDSQVYNQNISIIDKNSVYY